MHLGTHPTSRCCLQRARQAVIWGVRLLRASNRSGPHRLLPARKENRGRLHLGQAKARNKLRWHPTQNGGTPSNSDLKRRVSLHPVQRNEAAGRFPWSPISPKAEAEEQVQNEVYSRDQTQWNPDTLALFVLEETRVRDPFPQELRKTELVRAHPQTWQGRSWPGCDHSERENDVVGTSRQWVQHWRLHVAVDAGVDEE